MWLSELNGLVDAMYTVTMTKSLRYAFASMRHRLVSNTIAFWARGIRYR